MVTRRHAVHANGGVRPVAVLQCGPVRLRPLTEAECYARCYGGARTEQVSLLRRAARPAEQDEAAEERVLSARSARRKRRPHDAAVPELDLPAEVRGAPDRPAGAAAPDLVGLHVDVALASATLSASWPHPP